MNTYFRILSYGKPWGIYIPQYVIFTLFYVVFSVINLVLLIPLLDVLFNQVDQETIGAVSQLPDFRLDVAYFKDFFNYYFLNIIREEGKIGALKYVCLIIVIASLFANLFRYFVSVILAYIRAHVIKNLRNDIYANLTRLHLGYFTEKRKGDIVSRITNDVQQVEFTVVDSLKVLLQEPLFIIGQFALLFAISAKLTLYTLLMIPISGLIIGIISKRLKLKATEGQSSLGRITNHVEETLTGIRLIKAFTARNSVIKRFKEEVRIYAAITVSISKKADLASPFSEFLGLAVVALILLIGGTSVLQHDASLTASQFITFIIVFARIMQPAKAVANSYSFLQRGIASGERIFELIDSKSEILDAPDAVPAPLFSETLEFKNINFSYENKPVLKNINMVIPKGKTIALVGPSGGGKSALVDLIPRFYDPQSGQILLDGVDIRKYKLDSFRKQMGIVTQESILFNDTIFHNIAFGIEDPREETVINAARIANAHDFIMQTPDGYQTIIGERGTKLSGGQRQRLSIARAIMKNPPILILDEATSALDSESERLVQDALTKLMSHRTSIVIAHRLSTIQYADEIIVIDKGEIVERGSHESLIKKDGIYKKLNLIQKG